MAGYLALSPAMYWFGRDATLNSLMVFFVCGAIYKLMALRHDGRTHDYVLAGFCLGLAISSHYIAAPLPLLLILFHYTRAPEKRFGKNLALGLAAIAVGFLIGTPYFLLDWRKAASDLVAMSQLHLPDVGQSQNNELARRSYAVLAQLSRLVDNLFEFLDPWGVGFVLACFGIAAVRPIREQWKTIAWCAPALITSLLLVRTYHGTFYRYSLAVFLPLIVPAAMGLNQLVKRSGKFKNLRRAVCASIFLAFAGKTASYYHMEHLPDTRTLAKNWILAHVPSGTKILLMDPYNCPQFLMTTAQVERLLARTRLANHPRWHYYQALAHNNPEGGYEIYYWKRDLAQVEDMAERTKQAYQAQDVIDLNQAGLSAIEEAGIKIVVVRTDSLIRPMPDWIPETQRRYNLQAEFALRPGHTKGPSLQIYAVPQT
jgi:hypothetical protein